MPKTLITFHQYCRTRQPYTRIPVPSETQANKIYPVLIVDPNDPREDWICPCRSWEFGNRPCKHTAKLQICHWSQDLGPEEQTDDQRRKQICPRCGGPTIRELASE